MNGGGKEIKRTTIKTTKGTGYYGNFKNGNSRTGRVAGNISVLVMAGTGQTVS